MNADKKKMLEKAKIIIHNLIVLMRTKRIEDLARVVGYRGSKVVKNCGISNALKWAAGKNKSLSVGEKIISGVFDKES